MAINSDKWTCALGSQLEREFQNGSVPLMLQLSLCTGSTVSAPHHGMPITTTRHFQLWCYHVLLKQIFSPLSLKGVVCFNGSYSHMITAQFQLGKSFNSRGTILLRTLPSPSYSNSADTSIPRLLDWLLSLNDPHRSACNGLASYTGKGWNLWPYPCASPPHTFMNNPIQFCKRRCFQSRSDISPSHSTHIWRKNWKAILMHKTICTL